MAAFKYTMEVFILLLLSTATIFLYSVFGNHTLTRPIQADINVNRDSRIKLRGLTSNTVKATDITDINKESEFNGYKEVGLTRIAWEDRNNFTDFQNLLAVKHPKYLSDYKNPCWHEKVGNQNGGSNFELRCLPYFMIIGNQRSGSTELWWRLKGHPKVVSPVHKEIRWWNLRRYKANAASIDWYISTYNAASQTIDQNYVLRNGQRYHEHITGDGSVETLWDNKYWKNIEGNAPTLREPRFLNAHLIRNILPHLKIIILLRNPIDRYYSESFLVTATEKANGTRFDKMVRRHLAQFKHCLLGNSLRHCAYDEAFKHGNIAKGLYALHIKEWLKVFPPKQFLFLATAEFKINGVKVMNEVHDFLGIGPNPGLKPGPAVNNANQNDQTARYKKDGQILPRTRRLLAKFYQPYNAELYQLLRDKKFDFNSKEKDLMAGK